MALDIENVFGTSLESQQMAIELSIFFLSRPESSVLSMSFYQDFI